MTPDQYLKQALAAFLKDPPTTQFQMGYLAALLRMAVEASNLDDNDPTVLAVIDLIADMTKKQKAA